MLEDTGRMGSPPQVFALSEDLDVPRFESPACASTDPEIFFPVRPGDPELESEPNYKYRRHGKQINPIKVAKSICADCLHLEPCRDFAVENNIKYGVWGGTTERERRVLRKLIYGDGDG